MKKHTHHCWIGLVLLVLLADSVWAQQESQFSQYMNNNLLVNPAVTGIEPYLSLNMGCRNQSNNLNGALNTYYITAHTRYWGAKSEHSLPVRGANAQPRYEMVNENEGGDSPHGFGTYLFHDDQGLQVQSGVGLSYAYHLTIGDGNLSAGLSGGLIQYALDGNKLEPLDPSDHSILDKKMKTITGDLSGGLWWSTNQYYVGVAVNQLTQSKVTFNGVVGTANKQSNHYNVTAGYKLPMGESFVLLPSVLFKYVYPAPLSVDINALVSYQNNIMVGLSYRHEDAVVVLAGLHWRSFQLTYSYDINTSALAGYNKGSHEVSFGVGLGDGGEAGKSLHW